MRNVLIHDYDNVSFAEVAETIDSDVPTLHATVHRLIERPLLITLRRRSIDY